MPKKNLFTVLGVILAVMVASLALVFTVGPMVSAASEITIAGWEMFDIDENHVLHGFSDLGYQSIGYYYGPIRVEIPDGVVGIIRADWRAYTRSLPLDDGYGMHMNVFDDYARFIVSLNLPDSLEVIGECAFMDCHNLTDIELPKNLTRIDDGAFAGCDQLTSVKIPDQVDYIGERAFVGCWRLNQVKLPNNVNDGCTIGDFAFSATGLQSITIPDTVDLVGECIFDGCDPDLVINCACTEEDASERWYWGALDYYDGEYKTFNQINWNYVAPTDTDPEPETPVENDDENQVVVTAPKNNKSNALMAWIGGGIATGLGAIAAVAGIVAMKKRK